MKKKLTALITLFLPSVLAIPFLRVLGHKIGSNVKIGFSVLYLDYLEIDNDVSIGHFNIILNQKMYLKSKSVIGYLNILKGPFSLMLKEKSAIGNKNYITRGAKGITYGNSVLELGLLTKITTGHHLDLTQSIKFGNFSILAGVRSQMWTHGYVHEDKGEGRFRVDGKIEIGNNVYIGSGSIFNPGIKVNDAIHIGAGSIVSKNLIEQGMYVSQSLRRLEYKPLEIRKRLEKLEDKDLIEEVYLKK